MAPARPSNELTDWSNRSRVTTVLIVLTVLGLVLGIVGLIAPKAFGDDGGGDDAARNVVTSRATDFAVAYNTYDVADLADYQKRLKSVLTPKYDAQFVQVTNAIFTALKDKQQKSGDAKVLAVAVDSIDKDSAEALVAVDASITNTDNAAAVVRHFRWKVSFTKTKGEWLVSSFESVAAVTAEAGTPDASATPTTPAPTAPTTAGGDGQ